MRHEADTTRLIYMLLFLAALGASVGVWLYPWTGLEEQWGLLLFFWLTAVGWGYAVEKQYHPAVASGLFALFIGGLAYASVAGVATGWLLVGVLMGLAAWDLTHFRARLTGGIPVENGAALWRKHRRQLVLSTAVGGILATMTLLQPLTLPFPVALLMALLALFALSQLLRQVRSKK